MGDLGPKGADGVGPPPATAYQQLGSWPKGGAWTSDAKCKQLDIVNNLGGLCEPLCEVRSLEWEDCRVRLYPMIACLFTPLCGDPSLPLRVMVRREMRAHFPPMSIGFP